MTATMTCRAAVPTGSMFRRFARFVVAMLLGVAAAACTIPISYYDGTTYSNLTSLKAETGTLVESFDTTPVDKNKDAIATTTLAMRRALEYEKGKGSANSDTATQFELVSKSFATTVEEYRTSGPGTLGPKYFREAAVVLGQAFDIAISTEALKNKDKR